MSRGRAIRPCWPASGPPRRNLAARNSTQQAMTNSRRQQPRAPGAAGATRARPDVVHRQRAAMQPAPGDKGPVGAVPQPAQQHRRNDVDRLARAPRSVAPQRNVQIVAQEPAERHVPAAPEIPHRHRPVRRVEVERQPQAEHQPQADRHVGIAGEIEVDLQRVGQRRDPGLAPRPAAPVRPGGTADRPASPACRPARPSWSRRSGTA